jgi:hypothetical protein
VSEPAGWRALLAGLILAKNEVYELDPQHVERYTVPRPAAAEDDIAAFEHEFGERLPEQYRDLLLHADGWSSFYFDADLFGLAELRGEGSAAQARELLDVYDAEGALEDAGLSRDDVLPIAAGPGMPALFLLVRSGRPEAGQVSWMDAEEVDRYRNVVEFLASMRDYAHRQAERLRRQQESDDGQDS